MTYTFIQIRYEDNTINSDQPYRAPDSGFRTNTLVTRLPGSPGKHHQRHHTDSGLRPADGRGIGRYRNAF